MPASPETRIAVANAGLVGDGRALIIGFGRELAEALPHSVPFHQNLRAHRGVPGSRFGAWLEGERFDTVAIELPKAVGRLRLLLGMARALLEPGGRVVLSGHNDAGVRPAGRVLGEMIGEARTADTRYHCRIYVARLDEPRAARLSDWRAEFDDTVAGRALRVVSYPGIFAHGHVDDGTRMVLEALSVPEDARVLDVGSGSGVIGAWLAADGIYPDCVDVDAVAVEATKETIALAGGGRAWASDLYSDVGERYTHIVANAPFHAGLRPTLGIAAELVREAPHHLERDGELWLVANRFLDYPRHLNETFGTFEVVAESTRFRVYRARNR